MHQTESTREGDCFWGWHRYYTRHISSCSVLLTTPPPRHPPNLMKIRMGMQDARAGNCNFECLHYHLHKWINANNCQYITWSLRVRATRHDIVFICIESFKSPRGLVTPYGKTNLSSSTQARVCCLNGTRLPASILTYYQKGSVTYIWDQFRKKGWWTLSLKRDEREHS